MKLFDIFNPCAFGNLIDKANDDLSEKDLTRIMGYLDQAKHCVLSTLNKKKATRLCSKDKTRKAVIDFLLHKATTMRICYPVNQEFDTDVLIREVTQNADKSITVHGTYETEPDTVTIGDYGSAITKSNQVSVNLVIQPDDLNILSYNGEPPYRLGIQGWRKEITLR